MICAHEAITKATKYIDKIDAEILLCYVLDISKHDLVALRNIEINEERYEKFTSLVSRRKNNEPIAKIIKSKAFWDADFITTRDTLDPRPDSETIIEAFISIYKNKEENLRILDLGTGTGCLMISILMEYKNASGIGIEKNLRTYKIAKKNAAKIIGDNRCKIECKSWNDISLKKKYDAIISNPPYIRKNEISNLQEDVKKYDPRISLDGGADGLQCYREIFPLAKQILKKNGRFMCEIGIKQAKYVSILAKKNGFFTSQSFKDLSGIERCMVLRK